MSFAEEQATFQAHSPRRSVNLAQVESAQRRSLTASQRRRGCLSELPRLSGFGDRAFPLVGLTVCLSHSSRLAAPDSSN